MRANLLIMGLHLTLTFLMPLVPEQSREAMMQSGWRLFKGLTLGRGIPYAAAGRSTNSPGRPRNLTRLSSRHNNLHRRHFIKRGICHVPIAVDLVPGRVRVPRHRYRCRRAPATSCPLRSTRWRPRRAFQATRPQRRWQALTRGSRFGAVLQGGGQRWRWFSDFRGGGGARGKEPGSQPHRRHGRGRRGADDLAGEAGGDFGGQQPGPTLDAKAADGRDVRAFWRRPKGDGPFPSVVFIHGGLTQFPEEVLRRQLTVNPVVTRMLAAGYAVVQATFRTYEQDVQSRGPIEDVARWFMRWRRPPGWMRSAFRSLAVAAAAASRWNSVTIRQWRHRRGRAGHGSLHRHAYHRRVWSPARDHGRAGEIPHPGVAPRTLEKLKKRCAPVLILHGDRHDLHKLNAPLFVPLMKEAGVRVSIANIAGYGHGFYFGGGDDRWGKGPTTRSSLKSCGTCAPFWRRRYLPTTGRRTQRTNRRG